VTIARFRVRHQQALAGFLVQSLRLCAAAGLVRLGVVALDGTKVAANAATTASHTRPSANGGMRSGSPSRPPRPGPRQAPPDAPQAATP